MGSKSETFYQSKGKRCLDIFFSIVFILLFWWVYVIVYALVKISIGSPVLFRQERPGKDGEIFEILKFRTMTDTKNEAGELLPDDKRITKFGKILRATSLDELPEIFNILNEEMSLVGPRPFLVRDVVFMNESDRRRQNVLPGLTGLAQISGRNSITWEEKFALDLEYIENICFINDLKIMIKTLNKAFFNKEASKETALDLDYGDYLLKKNKVSYEYYKSCMDKACALLEDFRYGIRGASTFGLGKVSIIMPSYNTGEQIRNSINSVLKQSYRDWELIIIDDCSLDETGRIVKSFHDPRIRYYKNNKNMGAALSRNRGLRLAEGKWIAFLDSDDMWLENKLSDQLEFTVRNNYIFTFTDYIEKSEDGILSSFAYYGPNIVSKKEIMRYCYFSTITVIYDREKIGLVQIPYIKKNNDYAMWIKILDNAVAYRYPKVLSVYCRREGSLSNVSKIKLIKYHYLLFREVCHLRKIDSVWRTIINLFFGLHKKIFYRRKVRYRENVYS